MRILIVAVLSVLLSASFSAFAEVVVEDPSDAALNRAYEDYSKEDFMGGDGSRSGEEKYLLGLLYLNGSREFEVKQSCRLAFSELKDSWSDGVADAGYVLANMYRDGQCVEGDVDKAKYFLRESAEKGYLLSQRVLGRAYMGRDWSGYFEKNMSLAMCWLKKAGEQGDRQSLAGLAYIYKNGIGVKKDEGKSFIWLKRAASARFTENKRAEFPLLAEYYEKGVGTKIDLVQAYKYYDLSGSAGVEGKQRVAKEMTQEQIDEALRQSKEWQKEHNVQVGGGFIRRAN
ncbi:tetratricopeptide repeat protein [Salinicola endophyticus]|uniref:tetratricopeptide repeat protein n=1 Tax=Salinicola endophyticus TaxID=1949083 RepID=UPI00165EBE94|nr:tetratricopeptide repeat protein [Salinicola endophyticus]